MSASSGRGEGAIGWPIAIAFAATGLGMASGALMLAAIAGLAGLAAAPWLAVAWRFRPPHRAVAALGVFVIWAAATSLWSPVRDGDNVPVFLLVAATSALFVAGCGRLGNSGRARTQAALAFGAVSASVVFLGEAATGGAITAADRTSEVPQEQIWRSLGHGVSALVLLVPPVVALVWREGWPGRAAALLVIAAALVGGEVFGLTINLVGLAAAGLAMAAAAAAPRSTLRGLGLIAAALTLVAPVLGPLARLVPPALSDRLPLTWAHRLETWSYAADRILQSPLWGRGFDSARGIPETLTLRGVELAYIPLHPHNLGLHVWLETGLIGAALLAATLLMGSRRIAAAEGLGRRQAVAAAGAGAAFVAMSQASYGAWQEWWLAAAALAAGACLLLGPSGPAERAYGR